MVLFFLLSERSADNSASVSCPECGKILSRARDLQRHINSVHRKLRPFSCRYCGRGFADKSNKLRHERNKCKLRSSKRRHELKDGVANC